MKIKASKLNFGGKVDFLALLPDLKAFNYEYFFIIAAGLIFSCVFLVMAPDNAILIWFGYIIIAFLTSMFIDTAYFDKKKKNKIPTQIVSILITFFIYSNFYSLVQFAVKHRGNPKYGIENNIPVYFKLKNNSDPDKVKYKVEIYSKINEMKFDEIEFENYDKKTLEIFLSNMYYYRYKIYSDMLRNIGSCGQLSPDGKDFPNNCDNWSEFIKKHSKGIK